MMIFTLARSARSISGLIRENAKVVSLKPHTVTHVIRKLEIATSALKIINPPKKTIKCIARLNAKRTNIGQVGSRTSATVVKRRPLTVLPARI